MEIATPNAHHLCHEGTINDLCDVVRETTYAIHVYHGHGHRKKSMKMPWSTGWANSVFKFSSPLGHFPRNHLFVEVFHWLMNHLLSSRL